MKILFASTGGAGHFTPLVPWIDESLRRGHEVLVVGPPGLAPTVEPWRFPLRVGASPPAEEVAKIWAQVANMRHDDVGSLVIGEIFCRLNSGALLPVMSATCEDWAPDLVLRDPTEFASAVAAEERGFPHVRVGHGLASTKTDPSTMDMLYTLRGTLTTHPINSTTPGHAASQQNPNHQVSPQRAAS